MVVISRIRTAHTLLNRPIYKNMYIHIEYMINMVLKLRHDIYEDNDENQVKSIEKHYLNYR